MKEMVSTLLPLILFGIVVAVLSLIMRTENKKLHVLFPIQVTFMIVTLGICFSWFILGKEFVFNYGVCWEFVERGTLEAVSSVMGVVGVSCLFLGWSYGEREKSTLGCKQIEIIRHLFGHGYGLSLIIHFSATVLCWIMLKCEAREATLWAFATVLWGCIPQSIIFLRIVINRENRERNALELWKNKTVSTVDRFLIIREMTKHLNDSDIHRHEDYRKTIGAVIADWLLYCCSDTTADSVFRRESIRKSSVIYREISERIPKEERVLFEEGVSKYVCEYLSESESEEQKEAIALLCAGYVRYLFSQELEEMISRINRTMYYFQQKSDSYREFMELTKAFYYGLEWYQFLNQRRGLSEYVPVEQIKDISIQKIKEYFEELVFSIFENAKDYDNARIAFEQVYPGGE